MDNELCEAVKNVKSAWIEMLVAYMLYNALGKKPEKMKLLKVSLAKYFEVYKELKDIVKCN